MTSKFSARLLLCLTLFSYLSALGQPQPPNSAPEWQKHAWWCAQYDHGSSGSVYHRSRNGGFDGFDSVLQCQADAHNRGAVQAVQAAGRAAVNAYLGISPPQAPPPPPADSRPDWQKHASWCTTDQGSSGRAYHNARAQGINAFDAVISCQSDAHNEGAVQAVRAAGKAAVNAYLGAEPPRPPPPPRTRIDYQVTAHYECNPSGSCDLTAHSSKSCQDAYDQLKDMVAQRRGNACRQCNMNTIDNSKTVKGAPKYIQDGACRVSNQ